MVRKVISIRGEELDFDLFAIKQQILNAPKTEVTKSRERFIDKKRRRTNRNTVDQLLAQQKENEEKVRIALRKDKTDISSVEQPQPIIEAAQSEAPKHIIHKKK